MSSSKATLNDFTDECSQLHAEGFTALILHQETLILDVNQQACDWTGYTREELIGSKTWKLYAPESLPTMQANILRHADAHYDTAGLTKSGEKHNVSIKVLQLYYKDEAVRLAAFKIL